MGALLNFGDWESEAKSDKRLTTLMFDQWWALFPKRDHKRHALKMFAREITTAEKYNRLMRNTKLRIERQWRYRDLQFVPDPGTFLNRGDWEDDDPPVLNGKRETLGERIDRL